MEFKYADLTSRIIASAMEVHRELGCGFQEYVYQRALEIEFSIRGIQAIREYDMPIFYKNTHIATRRVDFLVENLISLELKAIANLESVHLAQALNYLEAHNIEIGLLINFGNTSLQFKRLLNKKYRPIIGP
jgi:GxxExxY protein